MSASDALIKQVKKIFPIIKRGSFLHSVLQSSSGHAVKHDINPNSLTNSFFIIKADLQLWSQGVGVGFFFFPLENSSVS